MLRLLADSQRIPEDRGNAVANTPKPKVTPDKGWTDRPKIRDDTAWYVVNKNQFERPRILIPGGEKFEFPLGTEGFRLSGSAQLATHHYIGDNAVEVQVLHRDESHIEISGILPGNTSDQNMNALRDILVKGTPKQGKILSLPGIFPKQQMVVVESYEFSHPEDERTDSIFYTITFIRVGVGKKVQRAKLAGPTPSSHVVPHKKKKPKRPIGQRIFTIRDTARTLRTVAKVVYGNPDKWKYVYWKNRKRIDGMHLPQHQIPTHIWAIGTKFYY
jgi:hypothetical protein